VDTPSALASLASLAGVMGVRERGLLMGAEESKERGFGPIEGALVVGTGVRIVSLLDGSGFGLGTKLFREAKEGTGAVVVQDIVVGLILLYNYPLGMGQYRAEEVTRREGGGEKESNEWHCSFAQKQIKRHANMTVKLRDGDVGCLSRTTASGHLRCGK